MGAVSACMATCPSMNCLCAWCCTGPRAAHTTDKTGICGYWPALCCFALFPCITLVYTNACTDMNERLGGEKQNIFMACLCAFFCFPCVVTQDAESLDMNTGSI